MRLTPNAFFRGLINLGGRCPFCGSSETRASRQAYEGHLARLLAVEVRRCKSCHHHFARPFGRPGARLSMPVLPRRGPPRCPACGGRDALVSSHDGPTWVSRLLARERYRCRGCRHRFNHTDWTWAATNVLVLAVLAGGLAFVASSLANRRPQDLPAPRIRSVPPLPPPAAR